MAQEICKSRAAAICLAKYKIANARTNEIVNALINNDIEWIHHPAFEAAAAAEVKAHARYVKARQAKSAKPT